MSFDFHQLRRMLLAAVLTTVAVAVVPAGATHVAAASTPITEGTVTWGIKESWRHYIASEGTITPAGGVTQNAAGEFVWPVTAGTFDDVTNSLHLNLGGSVHFTKYCGTGVCLLDSTFSDLSVVIDADQQVLRGTYAGRPQAEPGGPLQTVEDVVLASIDINGVTPATADGLTTWPPLPTHAVSGPFDLYPAGSLFDPVSVRYNGPGGFPQIDEQWATPGAPTFVNGANWNAGDYVLGRRAVYAAPHSGVVHVVEWYGSAGTPDPHYTVRALDATTLTETASTTVALGTRQSFRVAFDPATESIFYSAGTGTEVTVWLLGYAEGSYAAPEQIGQFDLGGNDTDRTVYSTVWNPVTHELAMIVGASDTPGFVGYLLDTFRQDDTGAWTTTSRPLSVAHTGAFAEATWMSGAFGAGVDEADRNVVRLAVARDGSYVATGSSQYQIGDEILVAPALWVRVEGTSAVATPIDGAVPAPATADGTVFAYQGVFTASDGSILLHASHWSSAYQYVDLVEDAAQVLGPPFTLGTELSSANVAAASDPARSLDYVFSATTRALSVIKDRTLLEVVPVTAGYNDVFPPMPLAVTGDGSIILQTRTGTFGNYQLGLRRLTLTGMTPAVQTQPADQTVALGAGQPTTPVTFTAAATGDPVVTQQWQSKAPGTSRFADLAGETAATLTVSATPAANGTQYRAVYTNMAGSVVSAAATLTVEYAPRVVHEASNQTIAAGGDAVFAIDADANPAPTFTWQHQNAGGEWQDITPADTGYIAEGFMLAVTDVTIAQSGAAFRAAVTNPLGTVHSRPATLTVIGGPTEPGPGEQQVTVDVADPSEGEFAWEIPGGSRDVALGAASDAGDHWAATGSLLPITVSDTRTSGPAWTLSGQLSEFTAGVSGRYLGWTPQILTPGAGATPGAVVPSGFVSGNGLADSAVLANALAGHAAGSTSIGAALDLRLPRDTPPGRYTATLTITALA